MTAFLSSIDPFLLGVITGMISTMMVASVFLSNSR